MLDIFYKVADFDQTILVLGREWVVGIFSVTKHVSYMIQAFKYRTDQIHFSQYKQDSERSLATFILYQIII